ncbi:TolC family protein [Hymenobacter terricola]|uniref:TolC family protein n=1 Tax=Hymenobacter terricola TaxID=2819236 RepID=UPI001B30B0BC|nr:TolC family protein [Hymenobacter terricola]
MKRPLILHWLGRCAALGLLLGLAPAAGAQTRLSLPEAIRLGLSTRYDAQANALNVALAETSVRQTRDAWRPELSLTGDVRYNTQLQQTVLPAGFGPTTERQRVALGAKNNTILSLSLSQPLYQPGLHTDTQVADNTRRLEIEKNAQQQTDRKVQIAEAYLNVLLKELQQTTAQAEEQRYQRYLALAEGQLRLGTLLPNDRLRAQVDYDNARLATQQAAQRYQLSLTTLRYRLNLPPGTALALTDHLEADQVTSYVFDSTAAPAERPEIRQVRLRQEGYRLQTQRVRDGLKPTVSLYANYSTQFLGANFNYLSDNWGPYNYVGVRFALPLTAQFRKQADLQAYELHARQAALDLQQTQADVAYEAQQAQTELANAARNLQRTAATLALVRQLAQTQQQTYRLGAVLYATVLDAEKTAQQAEQNHLEAAYSYLVAKLSYAKATGSF